MLTAYREGSIDLGKLKTWIETESPRITAQLPRRQLLKLHHGNDYARVAAIARLLPSCEKCAMIAAPRQFVSRQEYEDYSKRRDVSVASGTLRTISELQTIISGVLPSNTADAPSRPTCTVAGARCISKETLSIS